MILCIIDDDGEHHEIFNFGDNPMVPCQEDMEILEAINEKLEEMGY